MGMSLGILQGTEASPGSKDGDVSRDRSVARDIVVAGTCVPPYVLS